MYKRASIMYKKTVYIIGIFLWCSTLLFAKSSAETEQGVVVEDILAESSAETEQGVVAEDIQTFLEYINVKSTSLEDIRASIATYHNTYENNLYAKTQITLAEIDIFSYDMSSKTIERDLSSLNEAWQSYADHNTLTSEEYRVFAQLKNTYLRYLPLQQLIAESKLAYKYYTRAIDLDKSNALAHIQLGIWSLYAPKIGGGGTKKAIDRLKKGLTHSNSDYESYLGHLWLSQAYFKAGKNMQYTTELSKAKAIYGETVFYQIIVGLNEEGKIVGE